jgi:hypothetical protein
MAKPGPLISLDSDTGRKVRRNQNTRESWGRRLWQSAVDKAFDAVNMRRRRRESRLSLLVELCSTAQGASPDTRYRYG